MPEYALHPQSLLMETSWVVSWFLRLLRHAAEVKSATGMEPVSKGRCCAPSALWAAVARSLCFVEGCEGVHTASAGT